MTPEEIMTEFPFGAKASDVANEASYPIISFKKVGDSVLQVWAYPSKDFYLNTASAVSKGDGIIVTLEDSSDKWYLTPLSKQDSDKFSKSVQEFY